MTEVQKQTKRKLTKKQRGFVKDYVLTENGTQAALNNYDTTDYKTASVIAAENLDKPSIREEIAQVKKSVAEALTDELLLRVHMEGLNAVKMDGKGGMTIGFGADGVESMGHSEMLLPDYAVRHKYLDSAYKLKGLYAPEKSVNVNIELEADSTVRELTDRLNAIHRGTGLPSDGGTTRAVGDEAQDQERSGVSD